VIKITGTLHNLQHRFHWSTELSIMKFSIAPHPQTMTNRCPKVLPTGY
jgi:hypothetical protein